MASKSRRESNAWLKKVAADIKGDVLSIGSLNDDDCQGKKYRDYFTSAKSYTTSDTMAVCGEVDIVLDVRDMSSIEDGTFDCIFCSGVLEHVDDFMKGMREMTRILKPGGTLLLGLPFRQAIHVVPEDYWRFTCFGIEYMLIDDYDIQEMKAIDDKDKNFAASYWTRAIKKNV